MADNPTPTTKRRDKNGQRRGRPVGSGVKWNGKHAQFILEKLRNGETLIKICDAPNMPTTQQVAAWAMGHQNPPIPDFPEEYARARRLGHEAWAEQILTIPEECPAGDMAAVALVKVKVDARKWLLSKLRPELYGDRLQIQQSGGSATINVYLPQKPGDNARVVNAAPAQVTDRSEDSEA